MKKKESNPILYSGLWRTLAKELKSHGDMMFEISKHSSRWAYALKKVVPKEGTEYTKITKLISQLDSKGRESEIFKQVYL